MTCTATSLGAHVRVLACFKRPTHRLRRTCGSVIVVRHKKSHGHFAQGSKGVEETAIRSVLCCGRIRFAAQGVLCGASDWVCVKCVVVCVCACVCV